MNVGRLYLLGMIVIFVGFVFLILGSATSASSASVGGVVFIGPFPIVFGSGPGYGTLVTIAVIISLAMILMIFISVVRGRRNQQGQQQATYV